MTARRYAIVISRGRYASGSRVRAVSTTDDLGRARTKAARLTREHQQSMRSVGGTSGGYRVIESGGQREWLGVDLDRTPTA